ncbi:MAG TPA: AMP-binding protein [Terriglobia bacterium]|nr:AMP-binding protein [Terriglobia bacterium]
MATTPRPVKLDETGRNGGDPLVRPEPLASSRRDPTEVEQQTLTIVRELLEELGSHRAAESVSLHSSFDRDLGLGSLERVELLVRCEARFNTQLPDHIAQHATTPAEWVRALRNGSAISAKLSPARYSIVQPAREAPPAPESATTWTEVLRHHAEVEPHRVQIHLLEEDARGQDITYGQLLETASCVAAGLVERGLKRDETVAIMLPTCADFFYAFFGVMLAGGIPVPIYPPARPDKIEEYVRRQVGILRNAQVRFLISFDQVRSIAKIMRLSIPSLVDMTTVEALAQAGAASVARLTRSVSPSKTAFIQYTSGSTGDPKGVVLSQANVLANVRGIGWAVKFRPDDIVVSWLPLYHDMGLIGSWLFSVYFGAPITVLSPLAFLSRPERWLWALHDSRGTLCPAPNFSFELCARKIPDEALAGLDLSAWRVAINAGEAVLPDTLARFAERFEPYGFRPESYVPCYGLAESSVALAFPPINRRPVIDVIRRDRFAQEAKAVPAGPDNADVLRFVANGVPLPGHEVKIVDEEGQEVGERVQGRLWFRGLSRTAGYYRNPQATAAVVTEDGWMDSGDLAYQANGELFITGRVKDIIIKGGRNLIPQEVEAAAADVAGVRRGCVAAFGTADPATGTERLVVVAETRARAANERRRIESEIVKRVDAVVGVPPDQVVLVGPQTIPKTSSGKIRRTETRLLYQSARLETAKRPPWLQIAGLALENCESWVTLTLGRIRQGLARAYTSVLVTTVALMGGIAARLVPGKARARVVRWASRVLLGLSGQHLALSGVADLPSGRPALLISNRAGRFDPLVVAATTPLELRLVDSFAWSSLPRAVAWLLKPLALQPVYGEAAPPGGTLGQRVREELREGRSVLMFAEGASGAPAHLSRFRLDALRAAMETSSPVVPVGIRGTAGVLALNGARAHYPAKEASDGAGAGLRFGAPVPSEATDYHGLVARRERLREIIAELAR